MKNQLLWAFCLPLFFLMACNPEKTTDTSNEVNTTADSTAQQAAPAEFADPKYADLVRQANDAFTSRDVTKFMSYYADNAVYSWNSGDSLAGKQAIADYWTKRFAEVVDSLSFSNHIYLPINVNQPQSVEEKGIWVLSWYEIFARYKTGKTMTQWGHSDVHFNADGKIDRQIIYLDRLPISEAMKK